MPTARLVLSCVVSTSLAHAAFAQAQTTRESLSASGGEVAVPCRSPALSADGDRVAFVSAANDLVPGDANGQDDVFVRIRSLGTTVLASTSSTGAQGLGGASSAPAITRDGRWVVFSSTATGLVDGDVNTAGPDVFLKDLQTGTTRLLSRRPDGTQPLGASTRAVAADGAGTIAFETRAPFFQTSPAFSQIALLDRTTTTVTLSCLSYLPLTGTFANADCTRAAIASDGIAVAFESAATNLVIGDTNGVSDIFVWSRTTGRVVRASSSSLLGNSNGASFRASVSDDGRYVAFDSVATNLVVGDTNAVSDVFVFDRATVTLSRVSTDASGGQLAGASHTARISGDGRWISFVSESNDLVPGDANPGADVFQKDLASGVVALVSVATNGAPADAPPLALAGDRDGRFVAFETSATSLASGDTDSVEDVYLRDRGFATATIVCAGDGSGAPCPCGNPGQLGNGCENYSLSGGARLQAAGTPSVAAPTLTITVTGCPQSVTAVLFQGTAVDGAGFGTPFGDGLRCVAGSIARIGRKVVSLEGAAAFGYGIAGDPPISVEGFVPAGGGRRYYQVVYRIQGSFCFASPVNSSNSLAVDWFP